MYFVLRLFFSPNTYIFADSSKLEQEAFSSPLSNEYVLSPEKIILFQPSAIHMKTGVSP